MPLPRLPQEVATKKSAHDNQKIPAESRSWAAYQDENPLIRGRLIDSLI